MFSANNYAQQDTLKLKREARNLLREGNKLYNKQKFGDAAISYRKALEKDSQYNKASYNFGNTLYQEKKYKEAIAQFEVTAKTAKKQI
jgi:tetratricopeptide (TPR) repeat protein